MIVLGENENLGICYDGFLLGFNVDFLLETSKS